MKAIDEPRLGRDLEYRYQYLAEFIGFDRQDHAAIQSSAMFLGPLIPQLVDQTYQKLLSYDATARHFLPRQHGFGGPLPSGLADLATSSQVQFRKEHLARYFTQILTRSFDGKMAAYLDMVGKIHTPMAGNAEIDVPLVQMNVLMGLIADLITDTISQLPFDQPTMVKTIRAFQKLLWIQNDFISRHYAELPE